MTQRRKWRKWRKNVEIKNATTMWFVAIISPFLHFYIKTNYIKKQKRTNAFNISTLPLPLQKNGEMEKYKCKRA